MRGDPESPTQGLAVSDKAQNILFVNKSPPLASSQSWLLIFRIVVYKSSFETGPNNCDKWSCYTKPSDPKNLRTGSYPGCTPAENQNQGIVVDHRTRFRQFDGLFRVVVRYPVGELRPSVAEEILPYTLRQIINSESNRSIYLYRRDGRSNFFYCFFIV